MCILFRPDIFNLLPKERYEDINFTTDEKDKTKTGVRSDPARRMVRKSL